MTKRLTKKKNSRAAAAELEKIIMAQCITYDGETGTIKMPEARLLFAVISISILDLLNHLKPEPKAPAVKTEKSINSHGGKLQRHRELMHKAEDAEDFFFTERLEHFTEQLQLNADWIRNKVKTLLEMIREEKKGNK